jgi:hypothetical protein
VKKDSDNPAAIPHDTMAHEEVACTERIGIPARPDEGKIDQKGDMEGQGMSKSYEQWRGGGEVDGA